MNAEDERDLRRLRRAMARRQNYLRIKEDRASSSTAVAIGETQRKRPTLLDFVERIPRERLRTLLHLPMDKAAEELGISSSSLKRLCRIYQIKCWPSRQLAGVDCKIKRQEFELQSSQNQLPRVARETIAAHIRELRLHRQEIVEAVLEGEQDRYVGDSPSTWSRQLLFPTLGQGEEVVNSGNRSDLNYSSQAFMDSSDLPFPLGARFYFGAQYNGEIGEDIDLVPDDIRDLAELLLDSSDDADIVKDEWWLKLSPGRK